MRFRAERIDKRMDAEARRCDVPVGVGFVLQDFFEIIGREAYPNREAVPSQRPKMKVGKKLAREIRLSWREDPSRRGNFPNLN